MLSMKKKKKSPMSQYPEKLLVFILLACEIKILGELKISLAERIC